MSIKITKGKNFVSFNHFSMKKMAVIVIFYGWEEITESMSSEVVNESDIRARCSMASICAVISSEPRETSDDVAVGEDENIRRKRHIIRGVCLPFGRHAFFLVLQKQ
jgi:hypothetical protein